MLPPNATKKKKKDVTLNLTPDLENEAEKKLSTLEKKSTNPPKKPKLPKAKEKRNSEVNLKLTPDLEKQFNETFAAELALEKERKKPCDHNHEQIVEQRNKLNAANLEYNQKKEI